MQSLPDFLATKTKVATAATPAIITKAKSSISLYQLRIRTPVFLRSRMDFGVTSTSSSSLM